MSDCFWCHTQKKRDEYWDGDIPWVTPKEISVLDGAFVFDSVEKITEAGYKSCSTEILPANSLLMSSRAPIGLFAINKIPLCTNQGFKSLIPSDEVDVLFLYYYLKSRVEDIKSKGRGATFKEISKSIVENYQINLPIKNDQTRIATLLFKVESLIARRKKSIADLDELLKSTFLEMFSELESGSKRHKTARFDDLKSLEPGSFSNGPFGSDLLTKEINETGGVPVIYIRDIKHNEFCWISNKFVTKDKADSLPNCLVKKGDVLITKVGDPPGIAAVNNDMDLAVITQDVIRMRVDNKIANPIFIQGLLNSQFGKWLIKKITIKGTRSRFPLNKFKLIEFRIPPIDLQNQFATIVEKAETLKEKYQSSLNDLETLYGALSQKAFKGELDLSRIPLTVTLKPKNIKVETQVGEPTLIVQDKPDKAPETREEILHQLFKTFLSGAKNTPISLDDFWLEIEEKFMDFLDEDAPPLGVPDYDRVRDWLFDLLATGKVVQAFNEQENRMEIRVVS